MKTTAPSYIEHCSMPVIDGKNYTGEAAVTSKGGYNPFLCYLCDKEVFGGDSVYRQGGPHNACVRKAREYLKGRRYKR